MVARNVFCQHGALSTWELASNEQSIDLIDFRRHTLLVDTIFVELLSDAQDSTWGPSVELLLNVLQEELAVDFGLKFRVTSPWCSTNISAESASGEPARLFTDLDFSWFSELCALSLEPQQTSEATEAVDFEPLEPHIAEEPSTCHASEGSPLKSGDLLFHVLGHAVVSPQHRLTDSAMEVEVLLFVYSLDGCIPVVREGRPCTLPASGATLPLALQFRRLEWPSCSSLHDGLHSDDRVPGPGVDSPAFTPTPLRRTSGHSATNFPLSEAEPAKGAPALGHLPADPL